MQGVLGVARFSRASRVAAGLVGAVLCLGTVLTSHSASERSTAAQVPRWATDTSTLASEWEDDGRVPKTTPAPALESRVVTAPPFTAASCDRTGTAGAVVVSLGGAPDSAANVLTCLNAPVVGISTAPHSRGLWLVTADGDVFPFGGAQGFGSLAGTRLNQPVVGLAATPDGLGYWLVTADGGVFPFGGAQGYGSLAGTRLNRPIVGLAATPDGEGYWVVGADGGVWPFGNAIGWGGLGGVRLDAPVVGLASTPDGRGYWLAAADGGVFPFGSAAGAGAGVGHTSARVVGLASAPGGGYWLAERDGGVLAFGGAPDLHPRPTPHAVVGIGALSDGGAVLAEDTRDNADSTPSVPPMNGTRFALTFDDCGTRAQIEAILDALRAHAWRAAFFPTGRCRDANPWLIPELIAQGHIVCNHTYSHPRLTRLSDNAIRAEIDNGVHAGCDLFRPPYGDWDGPHGRVARIAGAAGYRIQMWDTDPRDWAGTPAWLIAAQIRGHGGVVVLHMQGPHTAEALRLL